MAVDRFRFLEKQRNYIGKMGSDDMRMKDVEARKAYIQNVRKSFDSPKRQYEFEKKTDAKGGEASDSFSFFKVRMLVAGFIFAAYVLCDKTGTEFYHLSTKDVSEKIAQSYDYGKIEEDALEVFHSLEKNWKR